MDELTSDEVRQGTTDAPIVPASLAAKWTEVRVAKAAYYDAKEEAASRKKVWGARQEEFGKAMEAIMEECPLFNDGSQGSPDQEPAQPQGDDAWRGELLSSIFLGMRGVVEKLHQAELQTMGQLADYLNKNHSLTDIEGIGAIKAEMMNEAMDAFWKKWNQRPQAEASPDAEPVAGPEQENAA